LHFIGSNYFR